MKIGKYEFDLLHKGYIMGILNVTPDSFSDGGKYDQLDRAFFFYFSSLVRKSSYHYV